MGGDREPTRRIPGGRAGPAASASRPDAAVVAASAWAAKAQVTAVTRFSAPTGPWLATVTCRVVGVLFVAAGALSAVFGEPADQHHNLMHLATGLVALVAGVSRVRSAARMFCVVVGAGNLAFGALGYLLGDAAADHLWNVGLLQLAAAEHFFHLVLGGVILAAGLFSTRQPAAW